MEEYHRLRFPAAVESLDEMLKMIIKGFDQTLKSSGQQPSALSFCFPGPANWEKGIIGDLENLPLFRGGVPLQAMLEAYFGIPVFINNDGDLFTYGENIAGFLPEVNRELEKAGNTKRYNNLLGVTFGTGFGGGLVTKGKMYTGDNSAGMEINRMRNKLYPETSAEDSVTIRAIKRVYAREAGIPVEQTPEPEEIYEIGVGEKTGDGEAARKAFLELAEVAGNSIADAVTLTDSLVVIGGGLSGAWPLFMQPLVDEMNYSFSDLSGNDLSRMEILAYNFENPDCRKDFLENTSVSVKVPFSNGVVEYEPVKKVTVGISRLGTAKAVAVGAYAFALNELS